MYHRFSNVGAGDKSGTNMDEYSFHSVSRNKPAVFPEKHVSFTAAIKHLLFSTGNYIEQGNCSYTVSGLLRHCEVVL